MTDFNLLGIDPGSSSGALSLYRIKDDAMDAMNMPDTMQDIYDLLVKIASLKRTVAVVENVGGSRPGNSSKSARTFAEHVGALKMALIAAKIPVVKAQPRTWMVGVCGSGTPTGSDSAKVKARKDYIYATLQRLYPGEKFTKRQADAVGLMHWARLLHGKGEIV